MSFEPRRAHRGFTLIEVLIAVAIVALLSLLGYRALAALSDSEEKLSTEATRWRTLDLFFARLEGDLRQAIPRPARLADAREPAWLGASDAAGNGLLAFSRAGPEFALEPASAGTRLEYRYHDGSV
ncbi:MAG TPA: prepilin-type N-terminal cleavage/methylation domain-containing protein, partial [Casimicrobiaceae bacterium]|nr:prepilin-type N-terminal cleavage/methylation domain-containing protein [Casimicrobiaceae bacterium]